MIQYWLLIQLNFIVPSYFLSLDLLWNLHIGYHTRTFENMQPTSTEPSHGGGFWWGWLFVCVGACSNCISGHQMGMCIQRCSSPQHMQWSNNADLLAVSRNAWFCHHRWCWLLIWVCQIRMCTVKRFFKSTIMFARCAHDVGAVESSEILALSRLVRYMQMIH